MKFSIIVPHYDGSISDEVFERGMKCLLAQEFKDFEVLVYHDGPPSRAVPMFGDGRFMKGHPNFSLRFGDKRENDWGHSNRNRGIKKAKGEYIIHFNPDNVLYPNALTVLDNETRKHYPVETANDILIYPILMRGMQTNGKVVWRDIPNAHKNFLIFTGLPTAKYNIDAMQLVMKKSKWLSYGGWYDTSKESDGEMYPRFVSDLGARYCSEVIGEHW